MQRHAARHAQASIRQWIEDFLTSLGVTSVIVQENHDPSELAGRTQHNAGAERAVYVTVGSRSRDAESELGGGNREVRYDLVLDVFGAPSSATKALAEDLFDLLTGATSFGNHPPFINQATGLDVVNERLWIEAVGMGPAIAGRGDWWQLGADLYRHYVPDGYL